MAEIWNRLMQLREVRKRRARREYLDAQALHTQAVQQELHAELAAHRQRAEAARAREEALADGAGLIAAQVVARLDYLPVLAQKVVACERTLKSRRDETSRADAEREAARRDYALQSRRRQVIEDVGERARRAELRQRDAREELRGEDLPTPAAASIAPTPAVPDRSNPRSKPCRRM